MPYGLLLIAAILGFDGSQKLAMFIQPDQGPPRSQAEMLAELYPDLAQRMEKSGDASVRCTITSLGSLTDCAVLSESPTGYNFGAATIRVARRMAVRPPFQAGHTVQVPIHWEIAPASAASARPAPAN